MAIMNSRRQVLLCTFVAILLLQACSSVQVDDTSRFVAQQRSMALADQDKGELASALDHWRVLLLAAPDDLWVRERVMQLEERLKDKAETAYSKGLSALRSGEQKQAKKFFVKTLVSQPFHTKALAQLREIQSTRMDKFQHAKATKTVPMGFVGGSEEQTLAGQDQLRPPPQVDKRLQLHIRKIKAYLATNQLFQADLQYQYAAQINSSDSAAIDELNRLSDQLAYSYYQHARQLIRSDINKAIEYLQISLRYVPAENVEELLQKSRLISDNLLKIQGAEPRKKNN